MSKNNSPTKKHLQTENSPTEQTKNGKISHNNTPELKKLQINSTKVDLKTEHEQNNKDLQDSSNKNVIMLPKGKEKESQVEIINHIPHSNDNDEETKEISKNSQENSNSSTLKENNPSGNSSQNNRFKEKNPESDEQAQENIDKNLEFNSKELEKKKQGESLSHNFKDKELREKKIDEEVKVPHSKLSGADMRRKRTLSSDKKKAEYCPNVDFYLDNLSAKYSASFTISDFLNKRKGDYYYLEMCHSFIQWILPNHFSSAFNSCSYALSPNEAKTFKENKEIANRLLKSYEIMLDFYGIKLENHELSKNSNYRTRMSDTLSIPTHNHLRMRRFLAHLNVVGFRSYAIKLVKFFRSETEKGGALSYVKDTVERTWSKYGEIDENDSKQAWALIKNCFPEEYIWQHKNDTQYFLNLLNEKSVIFKEKEKEKPEENFQDHIAKI